MKTFLNAAVATALIAFAPAAPAEDLKTVEAEQLVERGELLYEKDSPTPFTGTMVAHWPGGQKAAEVEYRGGLTHGKWTEWYENGQKELEAEFHDGELHGTVIEWYKTGEIKSEAEFREGGLVSMEAWDERGNPLNLWVEEVEPI